MPKMPIPGIWVSRKNSARRRDYKANPPQLNIHDYSASSEKVDSLSTFKVSPSTSTMITRSPLDTGAFESEMALHCSPAARTLPAGSRSVVAVAIVPIRLLGLLEA